MPAILSLSASTDAMTTAFTTSITGIGTSVQSYAIIAVPVALGIVALFFGVKMGMKFFKSLAK